MFDALVQELALERDDARRDLVDRLLPLIDRLDQPQRRAELVLDVRARLVAVVGVLVEQPAVDRADPELREPLLVQHRHVLILHLHDVDVGDHVLRLGRVVAAPGLRVEVADQLDVLLEIVNRHPELARQLGDLMVLQQPHVVGDDLLGRRPTHAEVPELQEQALLQVARRDADRVEALKQLEGLLDGLGQPAPGVLG